VKPSPAPANLRVAPQGTLVGRAQIERCLRLHATLSCPTRIVVLCPAGPFGSSIRLTGWTVPAKPAQVRVGRDELLGNDGNSGL